MLDKARGFLLLHHLGFPLRETWVDLQAGAFLEIGKQVFVDLIFIVNEEGRVQLLVSPVEVVVKLQKHQRRRLLEDAFFGLGVGASIGDEG